ncbi:MAG: hypothetical protein FE048_01225 [Thermoplasmata archaeon]|nr:MAG: hypothetical protein FE048_01225 [Thermoplasmata archaeon]
MQDIVAMAKNMRAVLYLKERNEGFIRFVLKYNRRRSIAVPDFMEMPEGKSFILALPPEKARKFYSKLNEREKVIFLSMLYIAPILTIPSCLDDFEKYEIMQIYSKENLNIREGLRHLRISEYSMLDYRLSEEENIKEYISKDLRRFWRIKNGNVKVGSYCSISIPNEMREVARGYAIVIGIEI